MVNKMAKTKKATAFNKTNVSDRIEVKLARSEGQRSETAKSKRAPNEKNDEMRVSSKEDEGATPAPTAPPIKNCQENNLELMTKSCGTVRIIAEINAQRFDDQTPHASAE